MPAKSQAQRGYLNAHFGHAWVKKHHFDNKGKLPAHVKKGKAMKKGKKGHGIDGQSMQAGTHMSFKGKKHGHGAMSQHKGSHTPKHGGGKASSHHMGKNEHYC